MKKTAAAVATLAVATLAVATTANISTATTALLATAGDSTQCVQLLQQLKWLKQQQLQKRGCNNNSCNSSSYVSSGCNNRKNQLQQKVNSGCGLSIQITLWTSRLCLY
jgi:hypothetical protein